MKNIFFVAIVLICTIGFGQNKIKFTYGYIHGDTFDFTALDGAGTLDPFNSNEFSLLYNKKLNNTLSIETGFNYFSADLNLQSAPLPETYTYKDHLSLLSIPITLEVEFLKYFYANVGALLSLQTNKSKFLESQTGIGASIGMGAKYEYKKITFYINPTLKVYRLIGFKKENYPKRITTSAINFGIAYNF